jgi:hypothetical protein
MEDVGARRRYFIVARRPAWRPFLIIEPEPDLQGDLVMRHLAALHMTPYFLYFKPADVADRLAGALHGPANGIVYGRR